MAMMDHRSIEDARRPTPVDLNPRAQSRQNTLTVQPRYLRRYKSTNSFTFFQRRKEKLKPDRFKTWNELHRSIEDFPLTRSLSPIFAGES
jgi:hypothetical protein